MQIIAFSLLCLVWGFSWVAIKLTLEGVPPFAGAAARFLVALPVLLLYALWKKIPIRTSRSTWGLIVLTSILTYAVDYGLIYWAEQYLSAGVTAVIFATYPIFTGLFSVWLISHERPGMGAFVGLVIGFCGVFIAFSEEVSAASSRGVVLSATFAVVLAALAAALSTVLVKRGLTGLHPSCLTFWQTAWGALFLVLFAVGAGEGIPETISMRALWGILYLGLIASALAFTLYYWLLQRISAVSSSTMIFVTPLIALVGDYLVFGRPMTLGMLAGASLVFLGIALVEFPRYRDLLRRRVVG